jgi:hypothetical protein
LAISPAAADHLCAIATAGRSTRRSLLAVATVVVATTIAAPGEASAAAVRECGDLPAQYAYNITTRRVSCPEARRVVRRWNRTAAQGGSPYVRGLYCRFREIGHEAGDIRCTGRGRRVVRWQTGV